MKRLIVCCDGTWNTADQSEGGIPTPTNVVKLYNAVAEQDAKKVEQVKYYHPGVGTDPGLLSKVVGGGLGAGLDRNIMSGYRFLADHYRTGDEIFLFGFSRGAYTARSLAGMIGCCGIMDPAGHDEPETWRLINEIYQEGYRKRERYETEGLSYHPAPGQSGEIPVRFLGVWDTVGALGIPEDLPLLGLLDRPEQYHFHDTALSRTVKNARHAVALDEKRASFEPTLWSGVEARDDVKQVWFPGVHADVGGGYAEAELSDGALKWMLDEARGCDLRVHQAASGQLHPDPQGVVHDSYSGVFKLLKSRPRPAPFVSEDADGHLHPSTNCRAATPSLMQGRYWAGQTLTPGQSATVDIFAAEHWNATGLYLETGARYEFRATGQWVDKRDKFGPGGRSEHGFSFGDVVRALSGAAGKAEAVIETLTHQQEVDLWWTKRVEEAPWFALIGFIANEHGRDDRQLPTGETVTIGDGTTLEPKQSGYLYCFANDAWRAYDNNRGSVALTVTRL